jgi:hypothetical protein
MSEEVKEKLKKVEDADREEEIKEKLAEVRMNKIAEIKLE